MKTIFLDRDGVINEDFGYVNKWSDFKFINGSLEALQILTKNNFNIIIVTNQAGIAKGYYSEAQFNRLTKQFNNYCLSKDVKILNTFFCPHHKDGVISKYKLACNCRKPNSGMFFKASKIYNLKLDKAFMVGDKISDIVASSGAGIEKNFLLNNEPNISYLNNKLKYKISKNLLSVTKEIINYND